MPGFKFAGDDPLRYTDKDTGEPIEVRYITDEESGTKVYFIIHNGRLHIIKSDPKAHKSTMWKRVLNIDEDRTVLDLLKPCDGAEKARIKQVTDKVSISLEPL